VTRATGGWNGSVAWLSIALLVTGCLQPALPRPVTSEVLRTTFAGTTWASDGTAAPTFVLEVQGTAPDELFIEANLPSPDASGPNVQHVLQRKRVTKAEGKVLFEGPYTKGWLPGQPYWYSARVFSDSDYLELLDELEQQAICFRPPDEVLKKLRPREP